MITPPTGTRGARPFKKPCQTREGGAFSTCKFLQRERERGRGLWIPLAHFLLFGPVSGDEQDLVNTNDVHQSQHVSRSLSITIYINTSIWIEKAHILSVKIPAPPGSLSPSLCLSLSLTLSLTLSLFLSLCLSLSMSLREGCHPPSAISSITMPASPGRQRS